jgi:serine/threonine protein kinase/Tfp pilus assembly protein PilF
VTIKCPQCDTDNPSDSKYCKECATPLPDQEVSVTKTLEAPANELSRGTTFAGRYEIIEELGKGGMGKVYRAEDKKIKEEVALKLIKPEIASDKKTIERFSHELKTARKIRHKNVCGMYDLGESKGTHYITMEYVPGEDLKSFIRRSRQLSTGTAITLAKQVCEGLAEAHRLGVIHRDIKPSNIMIDKEGNARIMDFGIARSLKSKGITGAGMMVGTPEYMSPEQVDGGEVDQRSDIYSLGVILYEMVTGRLPFEGDTPLSVAMKHKSEAPKEPREINIQIPYDLSSVILKSMEKNKENRYQRAEELLSKLSDIEKSISTTEKAAPARMPKTVKIRESKWKSLILYVGVAVVMIFLVAGGIYLFTRRGEAIDAIAVLPFENANPDTEYLSDGITESLINKLSQLPGMKKVIARGSVFRYKGKEVDPQAAGQELAVDAVLIGQMSERGDELSISVELMRVRDNSHIWGNQYKQNISEILTIQEEISNSIADGLRLKLTKEGAESLAKRDTENTEAYQAYLKGRYHWNKRTVEGFLKGIEYFEQAIAKDPTYALAYAGIADCYSFLGWHDFLPSGEVYPKARAAAEKALEIDEALAEAHTSLAFVKYLYDWDWPGAEREFKRAIELNPSYATAHQWFAQYLSNRARHDEAMAEAKQAQELDPLSLSIIHTMGLIFYQRRQYDQAIEQFQKILELDPNYIAAHWFLAYPYVQKAMYGEAIAEVQKAIDLTGKRAPPLVAWLGIAYSHSGERDKAKKVIEELVEISKQRYVAPCYIAFIYAGLGEKDKAFEWLDKGYEVRDDWFVGLKTSPLFDSLRSDPRFKVLLEKISSD